ncbi:MAG: hypothetical protein AAGD23_06190 [Pseudomonadota bacterium]
MTAHNASLLNAVVLITLSGWVYLTSAAPSWTILMPVGIGLALIACYPGVRAENKVIAHIAVLITLLTLFALFRPLMSVTGRGDTDGLIRVLVMMATTVFALAMFIKSFIDARKRRA